MCSAARTAIMPPQADATHRLNYLFATTYFHSYTWDIASSAAILLLAAAVFAAIDVETNLRGPRRWAGLGAAPPL
jgi:hypothetical protein